MAAGSRDYEALEYKPVTLNRFSCGDNCHLELTRRVEGAAPETILCTAPACAEWQKGGALPAAPGGTGPLPRHGQVARQENLSGEQLVREHL